MGMNYTEIAELHNDQPGFIFIEQTDTQLSSSKYRSSKTEHTTLHGAGNEIFLGFIHRGPLLSDGVNIL